MPLGIARFRTLRRLTVNACVFRDINHRLTPVTQQVDPAPGPVATFGKGRDRKHVRFNFNLLTDLTSRNLNHGRRSLAVDPESKLGWLGEGELHCDRDAGRGCEKRSSCFQLYTPRIDFRCIDKGCSDILIVSRNVHFGKYPAPSNFAGRRDTGQLLQTTRRRRGTGEQASRREKLGHSGVYAVAIRPCRPGLFNRL